MKRYLWGITLVFLLSSIIFDWAYSTATLAANKMPKTHPKVIVIDRFEGKYAVVELSNKKVVAIPKELLPDGAHEGDAIRIEVDKTTTLKKRNQASALMNECWKK